MEAISLYRVAPKRETRLTSHSNHLDYIGMEANEVEQLFQCIKMLMEVGCTSQREELIVSIEVCC